MNHIEFNKNAVQLIQSLQASLQELDQCGDVGGAVEGDVELLNTFMTENKIPQKPSDSVVKMMLEERDQYACIAISTAALTKEDEHLLTWINDNEDPNMVLIRDTGFLIKLYDEPEEIMNMLGKLDKSYNLGKLLLSALSAGYRMVEFDRDAELYKEGCLCNGLYTISM